MEHKSIHEFIPFLLIFISIGIIPLIFSIVSTYLDNKHFEKMYSKKEDIKYSFDTEIKFENTKRNKTKKSPYKQNNTWFIVEGCATPIRADQLQSYYHIIKVVHGTYEEANRIWQLTFYGTTI